MCWNWKVHKSSPFVCFFYAPKGLFMQNACKAGYTFKVRRYALCSSVTLKLSQAF